MSRIVAFGCSHTYGMGLEDAFIKDDLLKVPPFPSKHAWPSIVANKLNMPCVNKGICAGSNLEILYEILNYDFEPNDKVVVGWTTPLRDLLIYSDGNVRVASFLVNGKFTSKEIEQMTPNLFPGINIETVKDFNEKYFQIHSDEDMNRRSWLHQYNAGLHLKSKGIEFYFSSAWGWKECDLNIDDFVKKKNFLTELKDKELLDLAMDNMHMGPNAHQIFAEEVLNSVNW